MSTSEANPYRALPQVDAILAFPGVVALEARAGRDQLRSHAQAILDELRAEIRAGLGGAELGERVRVEALEQALEQHMRAAERRGIMPCINATGVVLHTGLGRAPVHPEAAEAMAAAAQGFCVLEIERASGARNQRDERISELLVALTGAEAGIAVNNNAGACVLALSTFAAGRETIVSRGELVEIGGSFRMPDVMGRAGTRLVEVGTTNRTRVADYRAGVTQDTGLLLKVHRSNFHLDGFVEEVGEAELGELGRELGLSAVYDLGSGLLELGGAPAALAGEPRVRSAVEAGLDAVTFSGDKLLGGPQAGLIVGRREAVEALRANPLYRALRLDKVSIVGLERTLELYLAGREQELPVRQMLGLSSEELEGRARQLAERLAAVACLSVEVRPAEGQPGSGSAPGVSLAGFAVRLECGRRSPEALAQALRDSDPPIYGRLREEAVWLDPRTLLPGDEELLVQAISRLGA